MVDDLILAFDTSGPHCDIAVLADGQCIIHMREDMTKGQATRLMPMIQDCLARADIAPGHLCAVGVGIGPGNFTGLRIGVAAARGMAMALGVPAIGVSALEAQAHDVPRPVLSCVDARQDRLYMQAFNAQGAEPPMMLDMATAGVQITTADVAVTGFAAHDLVKQAGQGRVVLPKHPLAVAIGIITQARWRRPQTRPAPLYLRPADAAPARDCGPVILQ
jgi:tRNA threonylcarbamoyl adenosine modification protein YeaZ